MYGDSPSGLVVALERTAGVRREREGGYVPPLQHSPLAQLAEAAAIAPGDSARGLYLPGATRVI